MHVLSRSLILIATVTLGGSALAAGESYMSLVGQLYGAVELPRLAKDHCGKAQPSLRKSIGDAYESWSRRNEPFLSKAREQFSRADVRAKKEGATLALFDELALSQLRSLDSRQFCQSYSELLSMKERQFAGDAKQLLEVVTYADSELSKRGE